MLELRTVKRTEPLLVAEMARHYSQPKGFVGRNICYAIYCNNVHYGHIVAGSATRFLPGRNEFLKTNALENLNLIINNIFFHVEKVNNQYPLRNFTTYVIKEFVKIAPRDWKQKYGDDAICIETLVELPRSGECYRRAGFQEIGLTKGYTCKRIAGKGTDNWTGKRVWDTKNLKPKRVFAYKL